MAQAVLYGRLVLLRRLWCDADDDIGSGFGTASGIHHGDGIITGSQVFRDFDDNVSGDMGDMVSDVCGCGGGEKWPTETGIHGVNDLIRILKEIANMHAGWGADYWRQMPHP